MKIKEKIKEFLKNFKEFLRKYLTNGRKYYIIYLKIKDKKGDF